MDIRELSSDDGVTGRCDLTEFILIYSCMQCVAFHYMASGVLATKPTRVEWHRYKRYGDIEL